MIFIGPALCGAVVVLTLAFAWRVLRLIWTESIPGRASVTQPWYLTAMMCVYPPSWPALWVIGYFPWVWLPF